MIEDTLLISRAGLLDEVCTKNCLLRLGEIPTSKIPEQVSSADMKPTACTLYPNLGLGKLSKWLRTMRNNTSPTGAPLEATSMAKAPRQRFCFRVETAGANIVLPPELSKLELIGSNRYRGKSSSWPTGRSHDSLEDFH